MAGYLWYGRNREGGRRVVVVWELVSLESRVSSSTRRVGVGGVEGRGEKEIDDRSGLCKSRGCESSKARELFEVMQVDVMKYEEKVFLMLWWEILMQELVWEQKLPK